MYSDPLFGKISLVFGHNVVRRVFARVEVVGYKHKLQRGGADGFHGVFEQRGIVGLEAKEAAGGENPEWVRRREA